MFEDTFGDRRYGEKTCDQMTAKDAEILRLQKENRKLREAMIRWRAIAEYGGGMEGQDYEVGFEDLEEEGNDPDPENTTTWGQKEFLADAERLLLEEGVI